jgi:hypothetical protein
MKSFYFDLSDTEKLKHDLRKISKRRVNENKKPLIETIADAKKENHVRVLALGVGKESEKAELLSKKLNSCSGKSKCSSAACKICVRMHKAWIFDQLYPLQKSRAPLNFITIIFYDLATENLEAIPTIIEKRKLSLRKQLDRSGISTAFGCFEIDYYSMSKKWIPSIHMIVDGHHSSIAKLRTFYNNQPTVSGREKIKDRPFLAKKARDLDDLITYIFKCMSQRIEHFGGKKNKASKKSTKKFRLKPNKLKQCLLTMDEIGFSNLTLLYGFKRFGSKIRKIH